MSRTKGSKNKSTATRKPRAIKVTGGANVAQEPHEETQETTGEETEADGNGAAASPAPASVAPESGAGSSPIVPVVGLRIKHQDGDVGTIVSLEPRGEHFAVSVKWDDEEEESRYAPVDWEDIATQSVPLNAGTAPTEPAPSSPVRRPAPAGQRALDDIGHEMADAQAQLDDLEAEKAAIVKDYGKRIGTVGARVSQLAAEYRQAERREEVDYDEGVVNVYSNRTGELLASRPLADSERQQVLPLDHPTAPPSADDGPGEAEETEDGREDTGEAQAEEP